MTLRKGDGYRTRPHWMPFDEWFWSWVDKTAGDQACWPWTRALDKRGYAKIRRHHGKSTDGVHRVAWELANGVPVPDGLEVLHSCDFPACCNPSHLRPGTKTDNVRDRVTRDRSARGTRNGQAKLNLDQVGEVKRLRREGLTLDVIAARTGINRSTVAAICSGRVWKD